MLIENIYILMNLLHEPDKLVFYFSNYYLKDYDLKYENFIEGLKELGLFEKSDIESSISLEDIDDDVGAFIDEAIRQYYRIDRKEFEVKILQFKKE